MSHHTVSHCTARTGGVARQKREKRERERERALSAGVGPGTGGGGRRRGRRLGPPRRCDLSRFVTYFYSLHFYNQGTWAPWLEWVAAHGVDVDGPVGVIYHNLLYFILLHYYQGTWAPWLEWVAAHGVDVDDPVPRGKLDREALRAKAPSAAVR